MTRSVVGIVEEQMTRWMLERQRWLWSAATDKKAAPADVVVLSVEYGAQGTDIANTVGELLSVPVYDHAIVAQIAKEAHVRTATVETVDETVQGPVDGYLVALVREKNFTQSDYFKVLSHTITELWQRGPCVLVGHGAEHIIPKDHRLAVRIVAPEESRRRLVAQRDCLDDKEARRQVAHKDEERRAFVRHFFHADVKDPLGFDMILNTYRLTVADCAATIVSSYRNMFPHSSENWPRLSPGC
jgi:cytidylate kinase